MYPPQVESVPGGTDVDVLLESLSLPVQGFHEARCVSPLFTNHACLRAVCTYAPPPNTGSADIPASPSGHKLQKRFHPFAACEAERFKRQSRVHRAAFQASD